MPFFLPLILKAHEKRQFVGIITEGEQGIGKTTYNIKYLIKVLGALDLIDEPNNPSWEDVKPYIFFRLDDLIEALVKAARAKEPYPCIIWDDAAIHGSKYLWSLGKQHEVRILQAVMDIVRAGASSIFINCPSREHLMAPLRGYRFYIANVMRMTEDRRVVKIYKLIGYRDWRRFVAQENFTCRMPDRVFWGYEPVRYAYFDQVLELMQKYKNYHELKEKLGLERMQKALEGFVPSPVTDAVAEVGQ